MSHFPILNAAPLEHEQFSAHRELESLLRKTVRGRISFDKGMRALYATDASNYRQFPIAVIEPQDAGDVAAALAACRSTGAAVLPRGAGTSLAGQTTNVAVVFDYSVAMRRLYWLSAEQKLAYVEPGIVLDRLREAAEEHHLTFAPDPATHSRCTLGGMMGNNSCGVHGLLGGKTVDNVESLDILLYDGTSMTVGKTSEEELAAIINAGGRKGEIYSQLRSLRNRYAGLIREKFPRIPRRVSGYNLDELLPENGFHVARSLVGSEGTCATIVGATLNLTSSPPYRVLTALGFGDAFLAADAVPLALEHEPIGLEGFDSLLLNFMRRKNLASNDIGLLPKGGGYLLVEMGAWSAEEAQSKAETLVQAAQSWPVRPTARIYTLQEAARVWHVRESALGATVFVPGEPEGWEGWEDAGVPPARLGDYLRRLTSLMNEYGYRSPYYGHYGQGCVHLRINFDFNTTAGIRKFREFLDRAADLVLEFGGSLSGEHGDGQARAALLPKMYGPELMQALVEFKRIWDPDNRMNPGKLVDAVRVYDPVENLRHGPHILHTHVETHFAFTADNGSLQHATERCVGVGACRKTTGGVMCPSYRATGEEKHSTRGRAHLLWEMLSGDLRDEGFASQAVHEALDLCLSCKACKSECPVQVDMAQYKSEFLAQRYNGKLHPLPHYLFGYADKLAQLGSLAPTLTNAILRTRIAKRIAGIAPERTLPQLAAKPYRSSRKFKPAPGSKTVLLWPDTWNNYYHPQTLHAADSLLLETGYSVTTPQQHICCGRPLYDFGLLDAARSYLKQILNTLAPQIDAGIPFLFLEPSCASVFKNELLELYPKNDRAKRLSEQTWLFADWLLEYASPLASDRLRGTNIQLHGHCHHKAVFGGMENEACLLTQAGATVQTVQAGCCGMAGPFGFEADKYEISRTIAEDGLLPAIRKASQDTLIVADGFSCREQIEQLGHRKAIHFAEALQTRIRK